MFIQRWFIDGSVKCFAGGHLPLAIMAMLILIFYVLLIIFAIAIAMKKIKVSKNIRVYVSIIQMFVTCLFYYHL